jgi:hypothetical protein
MGGGTVTGPGGRSHNTQQRHGPVGHNPTTRRQRHAHAHTQTFEKQCVQERASAGRRPRSRSTSIVLSPNPPPTCCSASTIRHYAYVHSQLLQHEEPMKDLRVKGVVVVGRDQAGEKGGTENARCQGGASTTQRSQQLPCLHTPHPAKKGT